MLRVSTRIVTSIPARVNQHVSIIRPKPDQLDAKFLCYLLTSKEYKDRLLATGEKGGATRQAITKAQIQEFAIRFPPTIEAQQEICRMLSDQEANTKNLQAIYTRKLAKLDELKQSLLQKAFTGQLTSRAHDPAKTEVDCVEAR